MGTRAHDCFETSDDAACSAMDPQWASVTGQPLDLGLESGFLGWPPNITDRRSPQYKWTAVHTEYHTGKCVPISSYEKLNQLGEGSK